MNITPLPAQLFILIEWMNGNPVLNGSTYYMTRKDAIKDSEKKMERYKTSGVLDNVEVKHRIITVHKKQ